MPWAERRWSFDLQVGAFLAVVERLAGTPARAAALLEGVREEVLGTRPPKGWSVKEHLGHLVDLHALDLRRVREFHGGAAVLSAADLSNRLTTEANHQSTPSPCLLRQLQQNRQELVQMLEILTESEIARTARHPRLQFPMRVIDWAQFVADHDDHHLATARLVLRSVSGSRT
jgi:DinB family protein